MFTLLNYRLTTRIAAAFGLIGLLFIAQAGASLLLLNNMRHDVAAQLADGSKGSAVAETLAAVTTQMVAKPPVCRHSPRVKPSI